MVSKLSFTPRFSEVNELTVLHSRRFNSLAKTAETVDGLAACANTWLKQGVNDMKSDFMISRSQIKELHARRGRNLASRGVVCRDAGLQTFAPAGAKDLRFSAL